MRKIILCVVIGIFVLGTLFFLFNPTLHTNLMRLLNQDILYLEDGDIVRGWIWDERGGIIVGETKREEIFIFSDKEYTHIERNKFLRLLRELI